MKLTYDEKSMSKYVLECISSHGPTTNFLIKLGAIPAIHECAAYVYKYKLDDDNVHINSYMYSASMRELSMISYVFIRFLDTYFKDEKHPSLPYFKYFNCFTRLSMYCKFTQNTETLSMVDNIVKYSYLFYTDFNFDIDEQAYKNYEPVPFSSEFDKDIGTMLIEFTIIRSTICYGARNVHIINNVKFVVSTPMTALAIMFMEYRERMYNDGLTYEPVLQDKQFFQNFRSKYEMSDLFKYVDEYIDTFKLKEVLAYYQKLIDLPK
jgi:hypothetical protein